MTITHKKDRFCLLLPEETSIYVHEHKKENEFIHQLVNLIASHETDMEQVKKLFEQQPFPSVVEQSSTLHREMTDIITALKMRAFILPIIVFCRRTIKI